LAGNEPDPDLLHRALPEDFIPALDTLPDSGMLLSLYILIRASDDDYPDAKCLSCSNGSTMFYRRDVDPQIPAELTCEWTFMYRICYQREMKAYEPAAEYERATSEADLDREVHLCEFLNPSPAPFQELVRQAPVRAVVLAASLGAIFESGRGPVSPAVKEALALRVRYVNETVRPRVLSDLVSAIEAVADTKAQQLPARILFHLGESALLTGCRSLHTLDLSEDLPEVEELVGFKGAPALEDLKLPNRLLTYMDLELLNALPIRKSAPRPVDVAEPVCDVLWDSREVRERMEFTDGPPAMDSLPDPSIWREDPDCHDPPGQTLQHAWSHSFGHQEYRDRNLQLYGLAEEYEKDGYYARPLARKYGEDIAVHMGECFLGPNLAPFEELARQAPVRAVAIAASLGWLLEAGKGPANPAVRDAVALRVRYIRELVRPQVLSDLVLDIETATGPKAQQLPARLLIHLGDAARVAACQSLRWLDLSGMSVDRSSLDGLRGASALEDLDLSSTWLTGMDLAFLEGIPLRKLSLSATRIWRFSLSSVSEIKTLEHLDISHTPIQEPVYLDKLAGRLKYLNIAGTWLAENVNHVEYLKEKLPGCEIDLGATGVSR
jgi:alkylhydroperoxidase family enzyme